MSLYASADNHVVTPIDEGTHPAICYGLIDLGEQYNEYYQKWKKKVLVLWEIPGEKFDFGCEKSMNRTISKTYTLSLNEKSDLRRDLAAWRGRDFTVAELKNFDLRNILGVPCLLSVIHREYGDRIFADVGSVMKLPKGILWNPRQNLASALIWMKTRSLCLTICRIGSAPASGKAVHFKQETLRNAINRSRNVNN